MTSEISAAFEIKACGELVADPGGRITPSPSTCERWPTHLGAAALPIWLLLDGPMPGTTRHDVRPIRTVSDTPLHKARDCREHAAGRRQQVDQLLDRHAGAMSGHLHGSRVAVA